jgi:hypothetical protein
VRVPDRLTMKVQGKAIVWSNQPRLLGLTAAVVTTATFGKSFVPFYLIGSTPIFAATCLVGLVLVALGWRQLYEDAGYVADVLIAMGLLYGVVTASYLVNSLHRVPVTDLIGILVFHALFIVFGFAAARATKAVFATLLVQAAIYLIVVIQYTIRFGDPMRDGYLHDIFGLGLSSVFVTTLHLQMGMSVALALLAALGLSSGTARYVVVTTLPIVFWFMFHIAARTAMVALASSLAFLVWADLWVRSRRLAIASLSAIVMSAAIASVLFYNFAVRDKSVDAIATDAFSRTVREIQSDDPGFRLPIWERSWHRIITDPDHLLLGKGIGSFAIDEGLGPPDWLLRKTEGARHSPHNIHLDMLYESGLLGMLMFTIVAAFPLVVSLRYWTLLSASETSVIAMYVFWLVTEEISGDFAFTYDFQFFLALAIGVVAARRKEPAAAGEPPKGISAEDPFKELTRPMVVH